ncbi:hypothetical protein GGQ19_000441 [Salinibacter ruber]|uniref:sulfotransferase family protein n=1 Tax=Salinibacter ruber TaxID=146919 RepID=UPI00216A0A76|nr:sulfotransferase [Salinibacter ruber]MCS3749290.1 hypothetical protein [Salinibacter ruber]
MGEYKKKGQIFVVGPHRSGTTWLANVIASHEDVYTPQCEQADGTHESAFFSAVAPYFRWGKTVQDRIALQSAFERSSFFRVALGAEKGPVAVENRSIYEYFGVVMHRAARRRGKERWLEKTPEHVYFIDEIKEEYPNAKLVGIKRRTINSVRSAVHKWSEPQQLYPWLKFAFRDEVMKSCLKYWKNELILLEYKQLEKKYDRSLKKIAESLSLKKEKFKGSRFSPNSSFEKERPDVGVIKYLAVYVAVLVVRLIPNVLVTTCSSMYMRQRSSLPDWFYDGCE